MNRSFAVVLMLAGATATAHAQKAPGDSPAGMMEAERMRMLNADKQKRMLADADKLLAMAQQLKSSVDATGRDELSVKVVRQADEIEKLAKSVKDRMRMN